MKIKQAFTLVELIVVITILAILGTIGFINLQGFSSSSRDSKRISELTEIRSGLQIYQARNMVLPTPSEQTVTIGSGSTNLIIQGYAGESVLNEIRMNGGSKDPLDEDKYYTYSVNANKTKFQLLSLLENNDNLTSYIIPTTHASYENRHPYIVGNIVGIFLDETTNTPIQELVTSIDLNTDTNNYKIVFLDETLTSSGIELYNNIIAKTNNIICDTGFTQYGNECKRYITSYDGGKRWSDTTYAISCNEYKNPNGEYAYVGNTGNGTYWIKPDSNPAFKVYCDMTTDGGGWTLVYKNNGGPSFQNNDSHNNMIATSVYDLVLPYSVSGNFGAQKSEAFDIMKNQTNKELLKKIIGYDNNGNEINISSLDVVEYPLINTPLNIKMILGGNKVMDLLRNSNDIPNSSCVTLENQVEVFIDGITQGKSNKLLKWSTASLGFANSGDLCGEEPDSTNIMKDWHTRHILGYHTNHIGRDTIRCQPRCWVAEDVNQLTEVLRYIK